MPKHTGRTKVGRYETRQSFALLPPALGRQFLNHPAEIDLDPAGSGNLLVKFQASTNRINGQYRVIENCGSYRITVPRWWLFEKRAQATDEIEILPTALPNVLLMTLVRAQTPAGTAQP